MITAKPDFFLIGAPKCGTTSLYSYLNQHPDVLSVVIKEPSFFATDMPNAQLTKTISAYSGLYTDHGNKRCGDYSTSYFHSKVAIGKIMAFNPKAKIIISLRQPGDCMISLFNQQRLSLNEPLEDFPSAWAASEERSKDKKYKDKRRNPVATIYKEAGQFGYYTQKVMDCVPKDQLHIILFDDLKSDPRGVYLALLKFLELEDDGRTIFETQAAAGQSRSRLLARLLSNRGPIGRVKKTIKTIFGLEHTNMMKKIQSVNSKAAEKFLLPDELRQEINAYFAEDVKLLESLIKRDLSHWR